MQRISIFFVALLCGGPVFAQSGDPLTDCINAARAAYGLYPLSYDGNLAAWAAINNTYGFGHTVMGPAARQNAAWGQPDCQTVVRDWMNSGGHRAALLDATITASGGAFNGSVWTWNGGHASVVPTAYVQTPQAPMKSGPPLTPQKTMPPPTKVVPAPQAPVYAAPQYVTPQCYSAPAKRRWRLFVRCR